MIGAAKRLVVFSAFSTKSARLMAKADDVT
jgi:hypothetical protein